MGMLNSSRKPSSPPEIDAPDKIFGDASLRRFLHHTYQEMKEMLLDHGCRCDRDRCFFASCHEVIEKRLQSFELPPARKAEDPSENSGQRGKFRLIHEEVVHLKRQSLKLEPKRDGGPVRKDKDKPNPKVKQDEENGWFRRPKWF